MKSIIYKPISSSLSYILRRNDKLLINSLLFSYHNFSTESIKNKLPKLIPGSIHYQQIIELLGNKPGIVINNTNDNHNKYLVDWTNSYKSPMNCIVCKPETTEEVSKILKYCNDNLIGVVPQGIYLSLMCYLLLTFIL
jgi:hypothetical protein